VIIGVRVTTSKRQTEKLAVRFRPAALRTSRSGKNFNHREQWLDARFRWLATNFGMDVLGFAIVSNHFHLILRNLPDVVAKKSLDAGCACVRSARTRRASQRNRVTKGFAPSPGYRRG